MAATTAHLGFASLALLAGCSLVVGAENSVPCHSDADCPYSGGAGSCVGGFCQPGGGNDDSGSSTGFTTTSSTDTSSGVDSSSEGPSTTGEESTTTGAQCSLNSECAMDERCNDRGQCVGLLSAECQVLEWPQEGRDDVVFLGSIMPTSPPFDNLVQPLENAVQLAIEDFDDETTLQGDRRIAWVGCDDTEGTAASVAAAQHLVDIVGVPAIIGPIFSESLIEVAQDVAIPAGVLLITPTATAVSISSLDDDDLVWRTIAPDVYQSNALVDRMLDVAPARLLILAKDDAYGNGILTTIDPALTIALDGIEIYVDTYPDPAMFDTQEEMLAAYGTVLAGALAGLPMMPTAPEDHYTDVIFIGTSEIQALLYAYLGQWATLYNPPPPMPRFTLSHGGVADMERFIEEIQPGTSAEALVPLKPLIEQHMEGTAPRVFNQANYNAFNIRYKIRFNNQDAITAAALSYDAALAAMFAMCTVADGTDVTGAALAAAMPRLADTAGEAVSVSGKGLEFIAQARNALVVQDGSIDLQGVSGELQWDLETGDVRADVLGWGILDMTMDGSDPTLAPLRVYTLNAEPATDGVWSDCMPICPL